MAMPTFKVVINTIAMVKVRIVLYNGEAITSEYHRIEVCYQYGQKTNERTTKEIKDFVECLFYTCWFAQCHTIYTVHKDGELMHFAGTAIGSFRVLR